MPARYTNICFIIILYFIYPMNCFVFFDEIFSHPSLSLSLSVIIDSSLIELLYYFVFHDVPYYMVYILVIFIIKRVSLANNYLYILF